MIADKEEALTIPWPQFDPSHTAAIQEIVNSSDRGIAIVGGAYLDSTLERTVLERLRKDGVAQKILRVNGPLGSFESKIDILYLLYGIEAPVRDALYAIKNIRNKFAHDLNIASFDSDDKKIVGGFQQLTLHLTHEFFPHHLVPIDSRRKMIKVDAKRDIFILNMAICSAYLMRDRVSHHLNSNLGRSQAELETHLQKCFPKGIPDA